MATTTMMMIIHLCLYPLRKISDKPLK